MVKFIGVGPVLAFWLAFLFCPVPDFVTQGLFGLVAMGLYAVIASVLLLTQPSLRRRGAGWWVAVGLPCVLAAVVCVVGRAILIANRPG